MTAKTTDQARCSELLVLDGTLWIHIGSLGWAGLGWARLHCNKLQLLSSDGDPRPVIGSARSEVRRLPRARPINGGYKN